MFIKKLGTCSRGWSIRPSKRDIEEVIADILEAWEHTFLHEHEFHEACSDFFSLAEDLLDRFGTATT